jgi:hypothetical protein
MEELDVTAKVAADAFEHDVTGLPVKLNAQK